MASALRKFNRTNLGLALSAASVILGLVLGLLQYPQMWYVLLLCVCPFPAILLLRRRHNIREPLVEQYLSDNLADSMLSAAVSPEVDCFPLCVRLSATRACGTAVAAITAVEIACSIRHLADTLNARIGEMLEEEVFTDEILRKHLVRIRRVHARVLGVINSLSSECVRLYPTGEALRTDLEGVAQQISDRAIEPLEELLKVMPNMDRETAADSIKMLITNRIPHALVKVLGRGGLPRIADHAEGIVERLRHDWSRGVRQVWTNAACRPKPVSPPPPHERIEGLLVKAP